MAGFALRPILFVGFFARRMVCALNGRAMARCVRLVLRCAAFDAVIAVFSETRTMYCDLGLVLAKIEWPGAPCSGGVAFGYFDQLPAKAFNRD